MSPEKAFVLGCYYYEVSNPIWYVYRGKLNYYAKNLKGLDLIAIRGTLDAIRKAAA